MRVILLMLIFCSFDLDRTSSILTKDLVYSLRVKGGKIAENIVRPHQHTFGSVAQISQSQRGAALDLSANSNSFVTIEKFDAFNVETVPMSIELVVKFDDVGTDRYMFSDHNTGLNNACIGAFHRMTTNTVRWWYTRAGVFEVCESASTVTTNTFYHLIFTRSGATGSWSLKCYFNGKLETTTSTVKNPAVASNAGAPTIGRAGSYTSGSFNLNGDVQSCNIWRRALTESEVQQRYRDFLSDRKKTIRQ